MSNVGLRILVCGSRTYGVPDVKLDSVADFEVDTMWSFLDGSFAYTVGDIPIAGDDLTIVHGGAKGADKLAGDWAVTREANLAVFEAEWDKHGKAAGPIRNKQMLDFGVDMVIAFLDKRLEESKGTRNMVTIARDAGVKTIVVEVL